MSLHPPRSSATAASGWRDETVDLPGVGATRLRISGCAARSAATPLVLHFHAGAFTAGSVDDAAATTGALVDAGAAVASIDYPLAPARPFPQAAEAGYAALGWLERKRRRLAGAHGPLLVAGEEAGGNLAAAVAMMARDRGGPAVAGAVLLSPMLDVCVGTASQRGALRGPVGCPWADGWRAYLARDADALHPNAAPAGALRLAGLPPTLLISAEDDPLRDETRAFATRLRAAGVEADTVLLRLPTGWPRSYREAGAAPWAGALAAPIAAFLERILQRHSDRSPA